MKTRTAAGRAVMRATERELYGVGGMEDEEEKDEL